MIIHSYLLRMINLTDDRYEWYPDYAYDFSNFAVKAGLARMLKGGVIMDVVNAEQVSLSSSILPTAPAPDGHLGDRN